MYNTTLPQEAVYSQQVYGAARGVTQVPESRVPWWVQGVEGPQTTQVRYDGDVRLAQSNQLSQLEMDRYERYLTVDRPYDLVVEGDRYTRSNGKPRKMDYSGKWRQVGNPYNYTEQQQQQVNYVQGPAQTSCVTEEVGSSPYGYQAVMPPVGRQVITERMQAPVERRIMSGRIY